MRSLALLLIGAGFSLSLASAAAPQLLPFQARLTDSAGAAVADGAKLILFQLYTTPTGGNAIWAGEMHKTTVNGGLVSVLLGSKVPFTDASSNPIDFSQTLYLQITVDANNDNQITAADPPLMPRQVVLPTVFAQQAGNSTKLAGNDWSSIIVNSSGVASNNPATGYLQGSKVLAGSIGSAQLQPGLALSGGQLTLPATTSASLGVISLGGASVLQAFGSNNFFVGSSAGNFSMTGTYNTATGSSAFISNTTGSANTATGETALYHNTSGSNNTGMGMATLQSNTAGFNNTATGSQGLLFNTTGNNNTALGMATLYSNTTGGSNTATGYQALLTNTTGSNNIALGFNAGSALTSGSNNIDIGHAGVAGEGGAIRIGTVGTQIATYVAGITGTTIAGGSPVVVSSQGQLGALSPRAYVAVTASNIGDIVHANSSGAAGAGSNNNYVNVPNQLITVMTGGGTVHIYLAGAGNNISFIGVNGAAGTNAVFAIIRDSTVVGSYYLTSVGATLSVPPGGISFDDQPPAGTHTYVLQVQYIGAGQWWANNVSLTAAEYR